MFNNNGGYSLADIAAATGNNGSGNNGGWGDTGAWWIVILFLFCFAGWGDNFGGNGRGGYGGAGMPVYQGTTTREEISYGFDMNNLENGIRGIQNGLCDGFYAQNNTMLTGFNGIQNSLCQGFNGVNTAMLQGFNGIQAQMANDALVAQNCCCQTQNQIATGFADLNYNLATQGCDTRRAIADNARDIIDSQNAGTRAILDFLTQDKIASLTAENQTLKFAASQATQNATLGAMMDANTAEILRRTAPIPVPAYPAANLYPYYNKCDLGCGI